MCDTPPIPPSSQLPLNLQPLTLTLTLRREAWDQVQYHLSLQACQGGTHPLSTRAATAIRRALSNLPIPIPVDLTG